SRSTARRPDRRTAQAPCRLSTGREPLRRKRRRGGGTRAQRAGPLLLMTESIFHLDTDFLVYAVSTRGAERRRMLKLLRSDATIEASSIAWYEFARGPRTPEQLAVARDIFSRDGIV